MSWHRNGDKPLREPLVTELTDVIFTGFDSMYNGVSYTSMTGSF